MSSLQAALNTKRTIDDGIGEPRNIRQNTAGDGTYADAKVTPAPRRCIQARNGAVEMQETHRRSCSSEQCIAAFQIHGLLVHQSNTKGRRDQRSQPDEVTSERNTNGPRTKKAKLDTQPDPEHAVAAIPSGNVASEPETGTLQKHGLNIHATEFAPGSVERQVGESDSCH